MFTEHQPKWYHLIITTVVLAILLFCVVLWIFEVPGSDIIKALTKISFVILSIGALWELFRRKAWSWAWIRSLFDTPPSLRGRWVGHRIIGEDRQRWVLEIYGQNLLSIKCFCIGERSNAYGYGARILSDPGSQKFKLVFVYDAKSDDPSAVAEGYWHDGVVILELNDSTSPRTLSGRQINARPSVASLFVSYESLQTKGTFD